MRERRTSQRRRTYLGGVIAYNSRSCTIECLVRDLSPSGAMIAIPSTISLPGEFEIAIHKQGESRPARTIWLTETRAGIQFYEHPTNVISLEAARRIRTLEEERRTLTRRIDEWTGP